MTRENKLALIVAFALILGVSVLLSDHLSSARTTSPGQVHETTRLPVVPNRPIRTLDDVVNDARVAGSTRQTPAGDRDAGSSGQAPDRPAVQLASNSASDLSGPTLLDTFLNALSDAPGAVSPERASGISDPLEFQGGGQDQIDGPLLLDQRIVRGSRRPELTNPATSGTVPGTPPASGRTGDPVRNHAVRAGESLFAIAAKYYGDGNLWRELARFNADRVKPNGTVNAGVSLRIPSRADLTGKPEVPSVAPGNPSPSPAPAVTPRTPARARTYTVASGDTLGDISRSTLGTSRRWREIYELNRDHIPNPDNVRAGTVLKIPET